MSIEQQSSAVFKKDEFTKTFDKWLQDEEMTEKPKCVRVLKKEGSGLLYVYLKKGQDQLIKIQRNTSQSVDVNIMDASNSEREQVLLKFNNSEEINSQASSTLEVSKQTRSTSSSVISKSKESTHESSVSLKKDQITTEETKALTEKKKASTKKSEINKLEIKTEDTTEEKIGREKNKDLTKKEIIEKQKAVKVEKNEKIVSVSTENTKKTLKELEAVEYSEKDSLRSPKFLVDTKLKSPKATSNGTIGIRDAKVVVKTGTDSFDLDNNPGHDLDSQNDIVRSFDQIIYLVSFSIQNENTKTKYSNIKYEVDSTLTEAFKNINGTFVNIGAIANGSNRDIPNGNGDQYSKGQMESVISDTGQVFVPITLNIFGPAHGTLITPTFELKIVEAKNEDTGEIEKINKVYDSSKLSGLSVRGTKVSARPSISVELVRGQIQKNTVLSSTLPMENAYDVAAVTTLKKLDERATGDYRGSTFPSGPINFDVKYGGTYQKGAATPVTIPSTAINPLYVESYAPAVKDRTTAPWQTTAGGRNVDISQFTRPLSAPHAMTHRIFNSQPLVNDKSEIGVYNSGDFTVTRNGSVKNENYSPTYNPYTYLMSGERSPSATDKSFSSLELIFSWDKQKTENAARANGWSRYDMTLKVDSVSYEDSSGNRFTNSNSSSITYPSLVAVPGSYTAASVIMTEQVDGLYTVKDTTIKIDNANPGTERYLGAYRNYGNAQISTGSRVWFSVLGQITGYTQAEKSAGSEHLFMWDSTAFKYDKTQKPSHYYYTTENNSAEYKYGVAKPAKLGDTPPYTMKIKKMDLDKDLYNWYDTPEEAEAYGDISAVLYIGKYDSTPVNSSMEKFAIVPVVVTATGGDETPAGNRIVFLGSQRFFDKEGNVLYESYKDGTAGKTGNGSITGTGVYKPTQFSSTGTPLSYPMEYWNHLGESAYVKKMSITTKTEVEKSLYQSNENVNVKVSGVLGGSHQNTVDASLTTTLPKGMNYIGPSKDSNGDSIEDKLQVTNNPDGTTTLKWTFPGKRLGEGIETHFTCGLDQTKLSYLNTGYTNNLTVKTLGDVWATNDLRDRDESSENIRSSLDSFMVQRMQQVVLSKSADKPLIEVGNTAPTAVPEDTSITYDVTLLNESLDNIVDGKLLDVLPFDNDGRGTKFSGDYTVTDIKMTGPSSTITFSNSSMPYDTDPNTISGWTTYKPGIDPISKVKDAKAILVSVPKLAVDEKVKLTVTIQPKNQKAGDVLVNNAQMNSDFKLQVNSQAVWTRVYGRDLTGYVWYDNDYNGLIDAGENPVENIPVKLYRTSQKKPNYADELVEKSLTGEAFVDTSGNSLIKTDAAGKYKFSNLPEGEYVAEFMVGDLVVRKIVIVTKKLVGSDDTKNSKADPNDYKTPEYNQPELNDLPTSSLLGTDNIHHITDVNAGLTPLSKIRLFKYEEGTAVDSDGNGKLSEAEIEASGRPLQGAEFDLYEGDSTNASDKIAGPVATDANGWLEFGGLPPGDYTIVETKAPDGFELLKNPIKVKVPTYNSIVKVHVSDKGQTKLPFTGGTKAMRIILISSAILLVVGMAGVYLHFRPIKVRRGS